MTIENYTKQLKNSEYGRDQIREIVTSGLRRFLNKQRRRKQAGETFHRQAEDTLVAMTRKELVEKTSWFKKNKKNEIGMLKRNKKKGETGDKNKCGAF